MNLIGKKPSGARRPLKCLKWLEREINRLGKIAAKRHEALHQQVMGGEKKIRKKRRKKSEPSLGRGYPRQENKSHDLKEEAWGDEPHIGAVS